MIEADPKTALYPGTFDPVTNGHLNIVERASRVFDVLIVSVVESPAKQGPLFTVDERVAMIRQSCQHLTNVRVEPFSGLLVEHARRMKARVLVKGLRAVTDFENEFQQALVNRSLEPSIETFFLATDVEFSFLSSSVVREVARLGGDVSHYVPAVVRDRLGEKFSR